MTTFQTDFLVTCIELLHNLNLVWVEVQARVHDTLHILSYIPTAAECLCVDLIGLRCRHQHSSYVLRRTNRNLSQTLIHSIVLPIDELH